MNYSKNQKKLDEHETKVPESSSKILPNEKKKVKEINSKVVPQKIPSDDGPKQQQASQAAFESQLQSGSARTEAARASQSGGVYRGSSGDDTSLKPKGEQKKASKRVK